MQWGMQRAEGGQAVTPEQERSLLKRIDDVRFAANSQDSVLAEFAAELADDAELLFAAYQRLKAAAKTAVVAFGSDAEQEAIRELGRLLAELEGGG